MNKIRELDGLRAFLAWWVVIDHLLGNAGFSNDNTFGVVQIFRNGALAVDVFIILSGFVIVLLLDREKISYKTFIIRRFFRLFPIYVICLILGWVGWFFICKLPVISPIETYHSESMFNHFSWQLLMHLTMLHGAIPNQILPYSGGAFLDPAWSISLEWQFYLVAPLLLYLVLRFKWGFPLLLGIIFILPKLVLRHWDFDFPSFLPIKLKLFLLGAISYYTARNFNGFKSNLISRDFLLFFAIGFPAIFSVNSYFILPCMIWLISLVLILQNDIRDGIVSNIIRNVLNQPIILTMGQVSYVTYLVHFPIIQIAKYFLTINLPKMGGGKMFVILSIITIPIIITSSLLLSRYIERPLIRFGRQLTQ